MRPRTVKNLLLYFITIMLASAHAIDLRQPYQETRRAAQVEWNWFFDQLKHKGSLTNKAIRDYTDVKLVDFSSKSACGFNRASRSDTRGLPDYRMSLWLVDINNDSVREVVWTNEGDGSGRYDTILGVYSIDAKGKIDKRLNFEETLKKAKIDFENTLAKYIPDHFDTSLFKTINGKNVLQFKGEKKSYKVLWEGKTMSLMNN